MADTVRYYDLSGRQRRSTLRPVRAEPIRPEMMRLYREHASALSRYAASFARNQEGARDAVQEIFLRYFIQRYGHQIENPRAWLYHVLRNYLRNVQQAGTNRGVTSANLGPDAQPSIRNRRSSVWL